jgi:hypothetical protein
MQPEIKQSALSLCDKVCDFIWIRIRYSQKQSDPKDSVAHYQSSVYTLPEPELLYALHCDIVRFCHIGKAFRL